MWISHLESLSQLNISKFLGFFQHGWNPSVTCFNDSSEINLHWVPGSSTAMFDDTLMGFFNSYWRMSPKERPARLLWYMINAIFWCFATQSFAGQSETFLLRKRCPVCVSEAGTGTTTTAGRQAVGKHEIPRDQPKSMDKRRPRATVETLALEAPSRHWPLDHLDGNGGFRTQGYPPASSIFMGFSTIIHLFWGPIFLEPQKWSCPAQKPSQAALQLESLGLDAITFPFWSHQVAYHYQHPTWGYKCHRGDTNVIGEIHSVIVGLPLTFVSPLWHHDLPAIHARRSPRESTEKYPPIPPISRYGCWLIPWMAATSCTWTRNSEVKHHETL